MNCSDDDIWWAYRLLFLGQKPGLYIRLWSRLRGLGQYNGEQQAAPLLHIEYIFSNNAPTAENQSVTTPEDTAINISLVSHDPDNDPLSYTYSTPLHGTLSGTGPDLTYTPTPGYAGTDSFTFKVNDDELDSNEATVSIEVFSPISTLDVRISSGNDDAEERANGSISLGSTDLELVQKSSTQTVRLRFYNINIPQEATILNASVQFRIDEIDSEPTALIIQGEAADHSETFSRSSFKITSRSRTLTSVDWSPPSGIPEGRLGWTS